MTGQRRPERSQPPNGAANGVSPPTLGPAGAVPVPIWAQEWYARGKVYLDADGLVRCADCARRVCEQCSMTAGKPVTHGDDEEFKRLDAEVQRDLDDLRIARRLYESEAGS